MARIAAVLVVIGGMLAAGPVQAQFGSNSPPRPPADIPNGFPAQPPPVQYPGQYPPAQQNQQYPAARAPNGFQAQPLPPPPGASGPPPAPRPAVSSAPPSQGTRNAPAPGGSPPQQANTTGQPAAGARNAPAGAASTATQQPADSQPTPPLPPDNSVVTQTPTQKIENGRAVFAGLDKITGRTISFDAALGETVQFGALQVTARACYTRPPTEATNTDAFVEVDEVTLQGEIKRIFTGWMFASSPGLHAVEHPIYDVWLTDCAAPAVSAVAQSAPAPAPAAAAAPAVPRTRQPPPRQAAPAPLPPPSPGGAPVTDD